MVKERLWRCCWLIASISLIVIVTISPTNFVIPEYLSPQIILDEFSRVSSVKDYWRNVLLFVPLGMSLAWVLAQNKFKYWAVLFFTLITSLGLSFTVEIAQFFIPSRVSNLTDVATNTVGGILGTSIFWWRREIVNLIQGIIGRNGNRLTVKSLMISFMVYLGFIALAVATLSSNINLNNWDDDFPLIIGNEATEDRPWQGYINALQVSDRAFSTSEISQVFSDAPPLLKETEPTLTSLIFVAEHDYYLDPSRNLSQNYLPRLVWQGNSAPKRNFLPQSLETEAILEKIRSDKGVLINSDRWLKTRQPPTKIINRLQHTNQFTLNAIFATERLNQTGPARIISLSRDVHHSNLILGQEDKDLVFRLRTPLTGDSASEPELVIPNVFDDTNLHHILITFDGCKLDFYVDSLPNQYSFTFEPEVTFLAYYPLVINFWKIDLAEFPKLIYQTAFYSLIFLPLSLLGGLLLSLVKANSSNKLLLTTLLCILPAFLIEQIYVQLTPRSIRSLNLFLSIAILSCGTLIFKHNYLHKANSNYRKSK